MAVGLDCRCRKRNECACEGDNTGEQRHASRHYWPNSGMQADASGPGDIQARYDVGSSGNIEFSEPPRLKEALRGGLLAGVVPQTMPPGLAFPMHSF